MKKLILSHITGITEPNLHSIKHVIRNQGFGGRISVARDLAVINLHHD